MLGPDFWDILSQDCKVPGRLLALSIHAVLRLAMVHDNPKYITVSDVVFPGNAGQTAPGRRADDGSAGYAESSGTFGIKDLMFWEMAAIEILLDKKGNIRSSPSTPT